MIRTIMPPTAVNAGKPRASGDDPTTNYQEDKTAQ